jgi:glycosyltransferase involved in cell wall biosynthesis
MAQNTKESMKYVLVTTARNEEAYIEQTLRSVVNQSFLPEKWVIVSDGSTDRTEEIVKKYLSANPWIELLVRPQRTDRSFSGKAHAFNEGCKLLEDVDYDIIGNLDADISFEPDYMKCLIEKFERDPELGVGGTDYVEGEFHSFRDSYISENHVNGQIQMFRKNCFDEIGGYLPIPYGGIDWVAVTTARMKGYRTRSFQDRVYNHLRKMGTEGTSVLGARFHYGKKDYFLGGHPLWQIFRSVFQMTKKPYATGGIALLAGYGWAWITIKKQVPKDLEQFHRVEQMNRLKGMFRSGLRLRG